MNSPSYIDVVLPVYNEGPGIVALIGDINRVLEGLGHTLILVDDGSTDGAVDALAEARMPHVQIVRHPHNKGLGEAVKTGLQTALASHADDAGAVVVMDSDSTHPPELIPAMLAQLAQGVDVVIASRFENKATVEGVTLFRQLLSHGASWLFRLFLPVPGVRDYTCGYRAYRMGILRKAFALYPDNRFITERLTCMADILYKLHCTGARFAEVPLALHYERKRSTSKMRVLSTIIQSVRLIGRYRLENRR